MARQRVGNTAPGAAVCRLIEQYRPEETRLFSDPLVKGMVGAPIRVLMQLSFLEPFHLCLQADVGNADYQASYFKPLGRKLVVSEVERIAQASVTKAGQEERKTNGTHRQ